MSIVNWCLVVIVSSELEVNVRENRWLKTEVVMMYYSEARCQTANPPLHCEKGEIGTLREGPKQDENSKEKKKCYEQTSGLNLGRLPGGGKAIMEAKELASVTLCV